MVVESHGQAAWDRICHRANVTCEAFMSNEDYPDEVTMGLVRATGQELGVETNPLLETFGEHWILKTANESYGSLIQATGSTLATFLRHLPALHSRLGMMFPKLHPPQFEVHELTPNSLHLHYRSSRSGLSPMVVGILRGLGKLYGTPVDVLLVESRRPASGGIHAVFIVEWEPHAGAQR